MEKIPYKFRKKCLYSFLNDYPLKSETTKNENSEKNTKINYSNDKNVYIL